MKKKEVHAVSIHQNKVFEGGDFSKEVEEFINNHKMNAFQATVWPNLVPAGHVVIVFDNLQDGLYFNMNFA